MTSRKLEILLVEDTPENMVVAKGYFDTVQDIIVTYASNRDDAIKLLEEKKFDGVITDRSIPGKDGEGSNSIWENCSYLQNNGWSVAMAAEVNNIPWVIHSEHGCSLYFHMVNHTPDVKKVCDRGKNFYSRLGVIPSDGIERSFEDELVSLGIKNIDEFIREYDYFIEQSDFAESYLRKNAVSVESIRTNLNKQHVESWKVALDYIKQKIDKQEYT